MVSEWENSICCICGQSMTFLGLPTEAFISYMHKQFTVNAGGLNDAYVVLFRFVLFFIGNLWEYCYFPIILGYTYTICGAVPHHLLDRSTPTFLVNAECVSSPSAALCLATEIVSFVCVLRPSTGRIPGLLHLSFLTCQAFSYFRRFWHLRWGPVCLLLIKQRSRERVSAWSWLCHDFHPSARLQLSVFAFLTK